MDLLIRCNEGFNHFMCNLYVGLRDYIKDKSQKNTIYLDSTSWGNFSDYYTSTMVDFGLYNENVLNNPNLIIARPFGGATWWHDLFIQNTVELKPDIKQIIQSCLAAIGSDYVAVSFRGTDRLTVNRDIFKKESEDELESLIKKFPDKKILLTTDDTELLIKWVDYQKIYNFGYINIAKKINTNSYLMANPKKSIHRLDDKILKNNQIVVSVYERNLATIIDYYMLFFASLIIPAKSGNFSKGALDIKKQFEKHNIDVKKLIQ